MQKAFRAIVRGRVQMVMYRDYAQRKARNLGVTGTVKNLDDGTVEVFAEGEESVVLDFIIRLKRGSILSRVDGVEVSWQPPTNTFMDFLILYE